LRKRSMACLGMRETRKEALQRVIRKIFRR
jgi:hypothetical protein